MKDYGEYDGLGLAELVRQRQVTAAELVEAAIARIEAVNPKLNAVTVKTFDAARAQAKSAPMHGPFAGVPYLSKDLLSSWKGVPCTNGCRYFADVVSDHDSEITARTKRAGFILLGKTNVPEMGWCLSTEPPWPGKTFNPWNQTRVPGGSSGGSAVAVAAGMVPIAESSDGAGSIRVPAAINGLVGLKVSRGRMTFAPDAADAWYGGAQYMGTTRTVRDCAAMLDALEGTFPGDPYNTPAPRRPYLAEVTANPKGLRIGFSIANPEGGGLAPPVAKAVQDTAAACASLGHRVEEFTFGYDYERLWTHYTRMVQVDTANYFGLMESVIGRPVRRDEVTGVVWTSIEAGRALTAIELHQALEVARMGSRQIATDLSRFDVVLLPTLPQGTRPLGHYDMSLDIHTYNAKLMGPDNPFMFPFNLSGLPAMSLPLAMAPDGMPIGVQLVGPPAGEAVLFRLAGQLEIDMPWWHRRPKP